MSDWILSGSGGAISSGSGGMGIAQGVDWSSPGGGLGVDFSHFFGGGIGIDMAATFGGEGEANFGAYRTVRANREDR
jgi:hypothetical protein